jgi:hypothetical protein
VTEPTVIAPRRCPGSEYIAAAIVVLLTDHDAFMQRPPAVTHST